MAEAFHRDPDSYQAAKKELKRAALEFHRFLELLKDYQVLE
jgi:tRNA(Leu) C34 or U34 (ribose-2'-O)-methylase TrmL